MPSVMKHAPKENILLVNGVKIEDWRRLSPEQRDAIRKAYQERLRLQIAQQDNDKTHRLPL